MSRIGILGAGAFGTALAVALARGGATAMLWARDAAVVAEMRASRTTAGRLRGIALPDLVSVTADIADLAGSDAVLLALPMQQIADFLAARGAAIDGMPLVACAKGIDLVTGRGPTALMAAACPHSAVAMLTGPSFAADIAKGLPTALTLACGDNAIGARLQGLLATPTLRLYRTTDVIGAELGGALKNVIAIAAGIVIGAGLGDSARAALMTRGYAEMQRLAQARGAQAETLAGLAGFGDLVLTCTSVQSRNFGLGHALGKGHPRDAHVTVEGIATARAATAIARKLGIDMPITAMVAALLDARLTVGEAVEVLMARPLKEE